MQQTVLINAFDCNYRNSIDDELCSIERLNQNSLIRSSFNWGFLI